MFFYIVWTKQWEFESSHPNVADRIRQHAVASQLHVRIYFNNYFNNCIHWFALCTTTNDKINLKENVDVITHRHVWDRFVTETSTVNRVLRYDGRQIDHTNLFNILKWKRFDCRKHLTSCSLITKTSCIGRTEVKSDRAKQKSKHAQRKW